MKKKWIGFVIITKHKALCGDGISSIDFYRNRNAAQKSIDEMGATNEYTVIKVEISEKISPKKFIKKVKKK